MEDNCGEANDPLRAVYEAVAALATDVNDRELWGPMMNELRREGGGPDACLEYLEAERRRVVQGIQQSLERLNLPSE